MSSGQRSFLWGVFGLLLILAFAFSKRDAGLGEGAQGSYLGRHVSTAQTVPANVRDTLANRAKANQSY